MSITMYGIPNCDTIKKAKRWLEQNNVAFEFHDYRKQGVDLAMIERFCSQLDWQTVINKRGTTYRQLTDEQKNTLSPETVGQLLVDSPAMIKRPILEINGTLHLGFKVEQYQALFSVQD